MSGTGHVNAGYPDDLLIRTSTGSLKIPTAIDRAWESVAATFKITEIKSWSFDMPSRNESTRARERLQTLTPICEEASLLTLDKEAGEYVREAKCRDTLESDELISTVVDAIARDYFRHVLRKQAHVTPVRRRTRA
jgi:hypothetical protein